MGSVYNTLCQLVAGLVLSAQFQPSLPEFSIALGVPPCGPQVYLPHQGSFLLGYPEVAVTVLNRNPTDHQAIPGSGPRVCPYQ